MTVLRQIRQAYIKVMWSAAIFAMAALMAISVAQVFCRYVLGFSLIWSEELSRGIMLWITFLFAGLAYDKGEIIALEVLREIIPRKLALGLLLLGNIAVIVLLVLLIKAGWTYAKIGGRQIMPALQVQQFWVYVSLPVGLGVFLAHFALRSIDTLMQLVCPTRSGNVTT
ncbi:TRAP transporter small permease [uncultured Roseovarius sp.]|uniref:TRAP transporter small permease n=1 Tax=uncultured Roseovarius sp. TaxID=293344 RepID=UPI0025FF76DB|nr:TRAP transporter small permease [uncultured Roseovarius sp.]